MLVTKNEKQFEEIRQDLLYLILDFLRQSSLTETSESLKKEGKLSSDIRVCDNIDLEIIFQHFIDYHLTKFNKIPKIRKEVDKLISPKKQKCFSNKKKNKSKPNFKHGDETNYEVIKTSTFSSIDRISELLKVTSISHKSCTQQSMIQGCNYICDKKNEIQLIKDLYPIDSELHEIAQIIMKEIISTNLNVHWSDIYGLDDCKKILQEAIIYPIKYPEVFSGKFSSWQGILLYGPPGTGKTMLAKAVATECKWTFFNITASSLVSKWRGDSEKYIRILCELARYYSPSIIFIDEIDWTSGSNMSNEKTSEPVRRFRAELLSRFDGIISLEKDNVALLAATNAPWDLDTALLRRLEKHILVDLPNECARRQILEYYTASDLHILESFNEIIKNTICYSGSDLKRLCKEAWMSQTRIYIKNFNKNVPSQPESSIQLINSITFLQEAQLIVLPTTKHLVERYKKWKDKKNPIYI